MRIQVGLEAGTHKYLCHSEEDLATGQSGISTKVMALGPAQRNLILVLLQNHTMFSQSENAKILPAQGAFALRLLPILTTLEDYV